MRRPGFSARGFLFRPGSVMESAPPRVSGATIGDTQLDVVAVLGDPDRKDDALGLEFWHYSQRQLTVLWREGEDRAHGIVVGGANAGAVATVTVGDLREAAIRAWGVPARIRQDGRFLDYVGSHWVLTLEVWHDTVVQMTLLSANGKTSK
jgi:hypothetical protein